MTTDSLVAQVQELQGIIKKQHADVTAFTESAGKEVKEIGERLFAIEKSGQLGNFHLAAQRAGAESVKKRAEAPDFGALAERRIKSAGLTISRRALVPTESKAVVSNGTVMSPATRNPGIAAAPERRRWLRDLMNALPASSGVVESCRESAFTNNAGPQVGGSPTAFENVTKPESNFAFDLIDERVTTIAHWTRASKQVLADSAQLQAFLSNRLGYGLQLEIEDQILNGNGTNGNLSGLLKAGNYTAYNRGATGDTRIDTLRKAIAQLAANEYIATAIVLNPDDWADIELTKDSEGRYIFAQPQMAAGPAMWGVPVLPTNAMTAATFMVADLSRAATLWEREDARVEASREDGDNFVKNMVTILAEERLSLTVELPAGIVAGAF